MKSFKKEVYQNTQVNKLILYGIFSLLEKKEKSIFENILKECFLFFPEVFKFDFNSQWPDARKIDRPLRLLKQQGLIQKNKECFILTKKREKIVQIFQEQLKQGQLKF